MPTQEINTIDAAPAVPAKPDQDYLRPLAIVTTLFFMWGFLTSLNDILVPHLKSIFELSYTRVMLVQFAFFSAYFLFSLPWSRIVSAIGYQRTMVAGLLTMAVGALLFLPAASMASYGLFLTALMVLAAGITGLQVAANPYVVVLGKPQTASSRLDLTQAFNSLGTTIAPKLGGLLILSTAPLAMEQLSLPSLRVRSDETALLLIDPQRSFTTGEWMRSLGPAGEAETMPIRLAFDNCARLLEVLYQRVHVMFTRCPFPPASYGWDDRLEGIIDPGQPYFIKPGNNVLIPATNGYREWVEALTRGGIEFLERVPIECGRNPHDYT